MPEYTKEQTVLASLRLENAKNDYQAAQLAYDQGYFKAANNRAYYCIFHAIRAVLALESVDFKSHSQIIGYFNKNYIHTGLIDTELSKIINLANGLRTDSDYNDFFIATKEESSEVLLGAKRFIEAITAYLDRLIPS